MSMNLNDLPALVERLQKLDRSLDLDALKTAVMAVEQAMADMSEKLGPTIAEAIVKGLAGAKFGGTGEAPSVNVTVPKFDIPAPVIHSMGSGPKQLVITPDRAANGVAKSYTVTIK